MLFLQKRTSDKGYKIVVNLNSRVHSNEYLRLHFLHLERPFSSLCRKPRGIMKHVTLTFYGGARDGAVVRVLNSHQCGPGSNPGVDAICGLSLLLVLSLAPRGFSPGTPVFPSPQKQAFSNCSWTSNQVDEESLCGCATSKSSLFIIIYLLFIYLYLFTSSHDRSSLTPTPQTRTKSLGLLSYLTRVRCSILHSRLIPSWSLHHCNCI